MRHLLHTQTLALALLILCFGVSLNNLNAQSFNSTGLTGADINNPTSIQFGPDDRLYVSQQDGAIKAFTVSNNGANYTVTATETINVIRQVLNHQDFNGQIFPGAVSRQVTGILVTGTASTPILYVTSSDYRIGGGGGGADLDLDTNSGMIHKLTKVGGAWQRLDLVRGLPRSEENHASNGMQLDGNTLYVAQGGHTNAGSPSNNFAFTTEYAYSAAVLTVDLAAINAMPTKTWAEDGSSYKYDLPTLDDPTRANTGPGGADVGDPFGGNDGLNQAKITANSPVQIYAPGFRNLYDLVLTQDGNLYGWDNGPNGGWGGHPTNEGSGTATNNWTSGEPGSTGPGPNDAQVNNLDALHFITGQGYYGGHPNPIRANPSGAGLFTQSGGGGGNAGTWRTSTSGANPLPSDWPPVPNNLANPIEGDYQNPGVDDPSVFNVQASTNGMCEYTSSAANGALQGDILAASFNGKLYRIQRNANGTINGAPAVSVLAENFGSTPLDVTAQGDAGIFPGTIWAATYGADNITVFTPTSGPIGGCQSVNSATLDNDNDGYTNADETQNGTDPCSQASTPPDADGTLINGFKVSDLNDPDDDDDGINDAIDAFALDATNGQSTQLPLDLPLLNGDPGTGFFGVGFTGLMTNGQDYLNNIADENNSTTEIIAGGAVGLFSINNQANGDAFNAFNTLKNGFQLGFPLSLSSPVTTLETKLLGPLWTGTPSNFQQAGIALSDGSQVNYLKLVPIYSGGFRVQVQYQENDTGVSSNNFAVTGIETASEIELFLEIDPATGLVQPGIDIGNGFQALGAPVQLQGNLLATVQGSAAPAVGIIASPAGSGTMNATWDYIRINQATGNVPGSWTTIDGNGTCNAHGQSGSCAQGRHEASYVQVGRKFYLLGGRENGSNVNIYDPATDTWTIGASPGFPVHHFQATEFEGLIYAIGIFKDNNFPNEQPYENVLIYDPARDRWFDGPAIPSARVRGSAGCVAYNGKLYIAGGITNGHTNGWSNKFDCYDPATGAWTILPNLPRSRDHFHAAVADGKLFVTGGRRSGQTSTFLPTISPVDVFDFAAGSWSRWPNNLPTPRAAPAVGVLNGELIVIGGERNAGAANDQVEALNLTTQTWRTLTPLNEGRHGTQAIVNNGAIYVASGSPNQGGGSTQTQERFTFNGSSPSVTGQVLAQAQLTNANSLNWPVLNNGQSQTESLTLTHSGGNQGAVIESISVSGAGFTLTGASLAGRLIEVGGALSIPVEYSKSPSSASSGTLTVVTSASGQNIVINLAAGSAGNAQMSINPSSIAFQTQAIGTTSTAVTVTISNTGQASATVNSITIGGAQSSAFAKTNVAGGDTIAAGASRTFNVTFTPTSAQPAVQQALLTIDFTGSVASITMNLTGEAQQTTGGNGADLELSASSTTPDPGQWRIGTGRFTLTNTGTSAASGVSVRLTLPAQMVYEGGNEATTSQGTFNPFAGGEWVIGTVAAGASVTIDYRVFNMTTAAQKVDAWVSAQNGSDQDSSPSANPDDEDDSTCFEFNGSGACSGSTGGGGTPMATLSVSPTSISFPTTNAGASSSRTVEITNSGDADAIVNSRAFTGGNTGDFTFANLGGSATIEAGGSETFTLIFAPGVSATGNKSSTFRIQFEGTLPQIDIAVNGSVTSTGGGGGTGPDLELTASATNGNPGQWRTGEGTFTLTNTGTSSASGIIVMLQLPTGFVYEGGNEATVSQGSFNPYNGGEWTVGSLAAGASVTIDYHVFNLVTSSLLVEAWVSAQNGTDQDSSPSNAPDGEDDSSCYEFNGAGACPSNGSGGGGGDPSGNVPAGFMAESGTVTVSQSSSTQWTTVNLNQSYNSPIVVAHLTGYAGGNPAHVRLRTITSNSFQVQVEEWEYLDGAHNAEVVSYTVVEEGTYDFGGGRTWVAGRANVDASFTGISGEPSGDYVAFAVPATNNDARACVVRQRRSGSNLEFSLQTEENVANDHATEDVHYLLISEGTGSLDGQKWEAVYGADNLTGNDRVFTYGSSFSASPSLLADMQTYDGPDAAYLRIKSSNISSFTGFVEEETSRDTEIAHTTEVGGYFVIESGQWGNATTAARRIGSFSAAARDRKVETYWPTNLNDNLLEDFVVERKNQDGSWMTIGVSAPTGSIVSLWDELPKTGVNTYRLTSRYADGTFTLSEELTVNFTIDHDAISVYPNPSSDQLTVYVPRFTDHDVSVTIVNSFGQVIDRHEFLDSTQDRLLISHDYPAGIYTVYVVTGGVRKSFNVFVVE